MDEILLHLGAKLLSFLGLQRLEVVQDFLHQQLRVKGLGCRFQDLEFRISQCLGLVGSRVLCLFKCRGLVHGLGLCFLGSFVFDLGIRACGYRSCG